MRAGKTNFGEVEKIQIIGSRRSYDVEVRNIPYGCEFSFQNLIRRLQSVAVIFFLLFMVAFSFTKYS